MPLTLRELLRARCWPTSVVGLSGKESELDLVVWKGGARGDPYPIDGMLFSPIPEPRRDPPAAAAAHAAAAMFEQNEMLDLRREL